MTLPRQRFTQYPAASVDDYADATTFLIANPQGTIKQATLEKMRELYLGDIRPATLTVTSAQVLALHSTPQTVVSALGAGKGIKVISASVKIDNPSAAYATNVALALQCNGAAEAQFVSNTALNASVTSTRLMTADTTFAATDTQIIANAALEVFVPSGDPTGGDADIEIHVLYQVIDV